MPKFVEGFAEKLKVPAGTDDVQVFDAKLPGFGIRKFKTGAASYFVKYNVGTQQRRKTLGRAVKGNLDDMRKEASTILAKAHLGTDVVGEAIATAEKAAAMATLGELVPRYLKAREGELRKKSLTETTRYLEKTWKPLHDLSIASIIRKDIVAILDGMKGKVAADRGRAALSGLFAWAIERGHVEANPTLNIKARSNSSRDRTLSEPELAEVWSACLDDDFGRIVRLLILTGQRCSEIGGLSWDEMPDGKRYIDLPGHRTKNGLPHIVPLSREALALLPERSETSDLVFGRGGLDGFRGWHAAKQALDARIAKVRGKHAKRMPHWTLHDIRRTAVTNLSESREDAEGEPAYSFAQPHVIEAIVNHVSGAAKKGVAGIYNKAVYLAEKREALEKWGAHIRKLVSRPQPAKPANPKQSSSRSASVPAA